MSDLPTELLKQRDYVRDEVLPIYRDLPAQAGMLAIKLTIEPALAMADEALKTHDAVGMVRALQELKDIEL